MRKSYNPFMADVWSLGVVLYTIIEGKCPFKLEFKSGMVQRLDRHDGTASLLLQLYDPPKKANGTLLKIIRNCIQVNPDDRPAVLDIYQMLKEGVDSLPLLKANCINLYNKEHNNNLTKASSGRPRRILSHKRVLI